MADRKWKWRGKSEQTKNDGRGNKKSDSTGEGSTRASESKKVQNHFRGNANDNKVDRGHKFGRSEKKKSGFKDVNPMATLMKALQTNDDVERILTLSSEKGGFLKLLEQQNIPNSSMFLILTALAKVSESSSEESTVELLVYFYMKMIPKLSVESNFYREIKLYIADWGKNITEKSFHRQKHVTAVQNLLKFLQRLQGTIRQRSSDAVQDLMQLITLQIEFVNQKGKSLNETITDLLATMNRSAESLKRFQIEKKKKEVLLEPPENFRAISIYPDVYDILSNHNPFIRPSEVVGSYIAGVNHYLDVQFRLLREDFIRPLREGITEYRRLQSNPEASAASKNHVKDLNVYHDVKIIGSILSNIDLLYSCEFDSTLLRHVRWECTKRLMSGSLVCLSSDNFNTFYIGTVAGERNPGRLARGQFNIKFEFEITTMPEPRPFVRYVMVESSVFFEAYRHNLKVLQKFGQNNFPLEKYIVDVDKDISPPTYLLENAVYRIPNGLSDAAARTLPVKVLDKLQWPPREVFNLDESQYEAFRAALTKQLVVIQGPPGTGKTYIGLRIVETLLANTRHRPILIVCYTNHALDQFLEGIQNFCRHGELIRIGGKSKSEAMEEYNLATLKARVRGSDSQSARQARYESHCQIDMYQADIRDCEKKIERLNDTLAGNELEEMIMRCNIQHYDQLQVLADGRGFNEGLLNWLGYAVNTQQRERYDGATGGAENANHFATHQESYGAAEMDEEEIIEMERARIIGDEDVYGDQYDDGLDDIVRHMRSIHMPSDTVNLAEIIPTVLEHDEGFISVTSKRKSSKKQFSIEVQKTESMSEAEAAAVEDINALSQNGRWNLYRLWIKSYVQEIQGEIRTLREALKNECIPFNTLRKRQDIEIVKKAKIIGMTTTGAAKYRHIIDALRPKIAIIEEAAEVLEAHIVTALCKETDHLILIGDHLQLRPNPAVYELAKRYNLEISLFERLIKNQMEYFQLKQQHRMRPCISSLLVPHIYKQLLDHPSVEKYENIKGIAKNMYFMNHGQSENSVQDTRSHMNVYEAEFIVELCRYLILQGYETSQITILTTYSGQLLQIRKLLRTKNLLNGVRAAVVDNYQGEENDIILLSFVRSNEEGNIGFLKTSNRVNVALSRARKGLYCIGNFDCLKRESKLWANLVEDLTAQEAIGDSLPIYCQYHIDYKNVVKSKDDFAVAPEGGCMQPCQARMPCGHACTSLCHIIDEGHIDAYKRCLKNCDRIICELDHRCPRRCHYDEECGDCMVLVEKYRPECGHTIKVSCSVDPSSVACKISCKKERFCGHQCRGTCSELCDTVSCNEKVKAKSPCGHTVTVACSNAEIDLKLLDSCKEPCNIELKCGHLCKGSCGQCKCGRLHISCDEKCPKTLICGHPCPDNCSVECAPCKKKCKSTCAHSKCSLRCGDPCRPCLKKCDWRCAHVECSKICSEPCDREPCTHSNPNTLEKCGHPSIGVCGEEMPGLCRTCDKDDEIFIANVEDARFIQLQDCEHIIEVNELIRWMESEPKSATSESKGIVRNNFQLKECPKCNVAIRHTKSLNTFVHATLQDIEQVKHKIRGDRTENEATQRNLNTKLKEIMDRGLFANETISLCDLYKDIYGETQFGRRFGAKPRHSLIALTNKFNLVETLRNICLAFEKRDEIHQNIQAKEVDKFQQRIKATAAFIKNYKNSEQQRYDISTEISFLQLMGDVIVKSCAQPFNELSKSLLNEALEMANFGRATETVRKEFSRLVTEACKHLLAPGMLLEYKQIVLRYMSFQRQNWFKCPNGHIYCIGESGDGMEKNKCSECDTMRLGELKEALNLL